MTWTTAATSQGAHTNAGADSAQIAAVVASPISRGGCHVVDLPGGETDALTVPLRTTDFPTAAPAPPMAGAATSSSLRYQRTYGTGRWSARYVTRPARRRDGTVPAPRAVYADAYRTTGDATFDERLPTVDLTRLCQLSAARTRAEASGHLTTDAA